MSTPAAQVLSNAAAAAAPASGTSAGSTPAAGAAGTTPAPGAANASQFWASWNLPEQKETRDWVQNKNYESPFTLAKTAQQLERETATLRAGKGYPIDTKNADGTLVPPPADAVKAWKLLTGVPETADKYEIPTPENNPYPQFKTYMAQEMLDAHVPAAMATRMAQGYERAVAKMEAEIRAQEDVQSTAALKELEVQWGPQYQERMALAARGKDW